MRIATNKGIGIRKKQVEPIIMATKNLRMPQGLAQKSSSRKISVWQDETGHYIQSLEPSSKITTGVVSQKYELKNIKWYDMIDNPNSVYKVFQFYSRCFSSFRTLTGNGLKL